MILFVGNLNKLTTEDEILGLFSGFGIVARLRLIVDRITHRSNGYAYIEMPEEKSALTALKNLNSSPFMERLLIVGIASKQSDEMNWR